MTNRYFDDSLKFREWIREYLDTHRNPSFAGAMIFVEERSVEEGITPPHTSTVKRLLKKEGYNMRLVKA